MSRLKSWLNKKDVNVRSYLKKPLSFEGMNDSARQAAEFEDRTKVATTIMDRYLDKDAEFTEIINDLCVARGSEGKAVFCSALREGLQDIQQIDRAAYLLSGNARGRKLVGA